MAQLQVPTERCEKQERQVSRQECNPFLTPTKRCQLVPRQQCQLVTKEVCDDRQCVVVPKEVCTTKEADPQLPGYGAAAACRTVEKEVCREEVKPECTQVQRTVTEQVGWFIAHFRVLHAVLTVTSRVPYTDFMK